MKRLLLIGFAGVALVVFTRATCCKGNGAHVTPVQKMEFVDHVRYHNMGITWDGEYYYTVNGGNTEYSDLNKYDDSGELDTEYHVGADGRAILYSPVEERLYIKPLGKSLDEVDLDVEGTSTDFDDIFTGEQSSVAMSPEGDRLYELYEGRVTVFLEGEEETSFKLSSYSKDEGYGYKNAIAASGKFLFVWAPNSDTDILVYGLDGKHVTKFSLPRSGYGFSLSWANGLLWIAEDADGGSDGADGTWYGYELKGLE